MPRPMVPSMKRESALSPGALAQLLNTEPVDILMSIGASASIWSSSNCRSQAVTKNSNSKMLLRTISYYQQYISSSTEFNLKLR